LCGLLLVAVVASCSPLKNRKAIVVDDDGRSMRFDGGRQESKNKKWNSSKSRAKQSKSQQKKFKKRRRY
jgi:hypothetical protein